MAHTSPSYFRCQGRRAYRDHGTPDMDPAVECPYRCEQYESAPGVWKDRPDCLADHHRENWIEGWEDAKAEELARQHELERAEIIAEEEFESLAAGCPWHDYNNPRGVKCAANDNQCCRGNCAVWHFWRKL